MVEKLVTRQESDPAYHWDLTPLFKDDQAFETGLDQISSEMTQLKKFKGKLATSAGQLHQALDTWLELERRISNLYVYSHLKNDQDKSDSFYQSMSAKAMAAYTKLDEIAAYIVPEILSIPSDKIKKFMENSESLQTYKHFLEDILRGKKHTLSEEVELLLAKGGQYFSKNSDIFSYLNNADLEFPTIKNEEGKDIQISHGNYGKLLESTDRQVRKSAFDGMYQVYHQFQNTFATILSTEIKKNNYFATIRTHASSRASSLFRNNIPESVYDALLDTVGDRIDLLHRYMSLRKELLQLDQVEMYDVYTPLLGDVPVKFSYEDAQDIILEALKPLGEEYLSIVKRAFDEKWIDVFENKGKRSGAYSSGSYDSNPYILMNYQEGIESMYTLIHELGHSLHSYLTNTHQPYVYSHYSIFLAEIASTTNENLLTAYLLDKYPQKDIQLYVINHFLDGVKGTIFRQTQFAEFEHAIYTKDAKGEPLTADALNQLYQELNQKYYGPDVNSDSAIEVEWARIPHFYFNYYVFQYATGFSAATALAQAILDGEEGALDKYLDYLKAGNSQYPIEVMKIAGIDMTKKDYIEKALDVFEKRLDQFENILKDS